jgi:ABC-type transporter Mla MlaB component
MALPVPQTIDVALEGPIARTDLPRLCARVSALLEASGAGLALCDVSEVDADGMAIDALARLQLGARRHGCRVCLRNASRELLELLAFTGLADVLQD